LEADGLYRDIDDFSEIPFGHSSLSGSIHALNANPDIMRWWLKVEHEAKDVAKK
jgi:hypothetical protein